MWKPIKEENEPKKIEPKEVFIVPEALENKTDTWIIGEIPLQTEQVIVNTKTNKTYTLLEAVIFLLNQIEKK